jgi:hypothetical protein
MLLEVAVSAGVTVVTLVVVDAVVAEEVEEEDEGTSVDDDVTMMNVGNVAFDAVISVVLVPVVVLLVSAAA